MSENDRSRRQFVALTGGLTLAGIAGTAAASVDDSRSAASTQPASMTPVEPTDVNVSEADADVTRSSYTILDGTEHATTVYVIRADTDGPTAMVVGGVHGNEKAGYRAAGEIKDWTIDAGTLVVLPRANQVAIERGTRFGENGDLNRHFPSNEEPTTQLARAIWNVVQRFEPELVIDLHSSEGIYDPEDDAESEGVGQAIFHSLGEVAGEEAKEVAGYMNEHHIETEKYEFHVGPITPTYTPTGLLVGKVATDTEGRSQLVETTREGTTLETRVRWTKLVVRKLLLGDVLRYEGAENAEPVAKITTDPSNADERNFSRGATVTLDGSASSDPNGEIVEYAWDLDDDGTFEETGETAEIALEFCGELPVALRVTDGGGNSDTASVTLSTV